MAQVGLFVVLDGIDGCGKSTQAERLVAALRARRGDRADRADRSGEVLHLREPGSTALGEALRTLLLSREQRVAPATEVLLFVAARRQMLEEVVAPALSAGAAVVCERFHPSTFAYQGRAGGVGEERVATLVEGWADDPRPDLELILDLDPEQALDRRATGGDRIEDRGLEFQASVAEGYRRYAQRVPRARLVDGGGTVEEVAQRVLAALGESLR